MTKSNPKETSRRSGSGALGNRREAELVFMAMVIQAGRRYRAQLDDELRDVGIGTAAMETLSTIEVLPKPITQTEVAARMGIEGPTLTRMIKKLESDGLVLRRRDANDGRANVIELSGAGRTLLEKALVIASRFRRATLADASSYEMEAGRDMLERIISRLRANK